MVSSLTVSQLLITDLQRHPDPLSAAQLAAARHFHVSGYVRQRLPAEHPSRRALLPDALQLGTRHTRVRAEMRTLLRGWAELNVPALLFKGFALSEFDYATPGERFCGDVDVLLPNDPAMIARAVHYALALGWRSDGQHADPAHWTHECAHLYSPGGEVRLDVHRFVTAWQVGRQERVRRLTEQVWTASEKYDWDGVPVSLLSPADRAVVGVALCRSWGGDAGGLKAADYTDLEQLYAQHDLRPEVLNARAAELGGLETWRAFGQVCNPLTRTLALDAPATAPTLLAAAKADGYNQEHIKWAARRRDLGRRLGLIVGALPDVLLAWVGWRRRRDPRAVLAPWAMPVSGQLDLFHQTEIVATVGWWTKLLYPRQSREGVCVPRAYATFRALRRRGHPAVFVSGVAHSDGRVTGHAWIEDQHGVLEPYNEPLVRQRFRELFRFPQG